MRGWLVRGKAWLLPGKRTYLTLQPTAFKAGRTRGFAPGYQQKPGPLSPAPQPRVQYVSQGIPEHAEGEYRQRYEQAGNDCDHRGKEQVFNPLGQHLAPGGRGWRYAEPQESKRAFRDDGHTHKPGEHHHVRSQASTERCASG